MAKYQQKRNVLILSTGRCLKCFGDMMCPGYLQLGGLGLQYGSDGSVTLDPEEEPLTQAEREEIADYFIAKWHAWKRRA